MDTQNFVKDLDTLLLDKSAARVAVGKRTVILSCAFVCISSKADSQI